MTLSISARCFSGISSAFDTLSMNASTLLKVKSVKRNWKDKLFCAAVSRDEVTEATEDFSRQCFEGKLELWQHVGHVLEAMQGAAEDLDLDGRLVQS